MKIYNFGLNIEPGKYKYKNNYFNKLVEKFSPKVVTPYVVEFLDTDIDRCEAVVFDKEKRLDFVLIDLEKIEKRVIKSDDENEKKILQKAQEALETESLLNEVSFSEEEKEVLKTLQLVTLKPAVEKNASEDIHINELLSDLLCKAEIILFFTAGKKEVHAWSVKKGENILEAAGKIHSDLKRGFIKGEVVSCQHLDDFFNIAEAKSRGFVKIVDRDYLMQEADIIEIRFNV